MPQPVPGKLFWSVTAYDAQTRSQVQTDQGKAALRSLFELKDAASLPSVDLYFGPVPPAGQEARWIKTAPGNGLVRLLPHLRTGAGRLRQELEAGRLRGDRATIDRAGIAVNGSSSSIGG